MKYIDTARRPPSEPTHGLEPLVERPHIREFLESSFPHLRTSPARLELIGASLALAPYFRVPLESAFLGMFASLESLVMALRPGTSGAAFLPSGRWHRLRRSLFLALQSWADGGGPLTPHQLTTIYRKLPELNRPSFADAWYGHIASRSIPVSDLWPMAARDGLLDLLKIRNKLAHGEMVPEAAATGLSNALLSLRWLLERVALDAVGFDLANTDASPTRLFGRQLHPVIHLPQHRKGITEAWKT